ncbi:MAG: rod shape-determining protein MreD [Aeromonadaceae bacterium]
MNLTGHGKGSIYLTILLALLLAIVPLPAIIDPYRPDWLVLVVLYWVIALPHRVNVGTAWIAGLSLDILLGSTLGVRALAMAIMAYVAAMQFQKIRNFSVWQQAVVVGIITLLGQLTVFWAEHLFAVVTMNYRMFWSCLSTTLLWPWVFLLLRKMRRKYHIR